MGASDGARRPSDTSSTAMRVAVSTHTRPGELPGIGSELEVDEITGLEGSGQGDHVEETDIEGDLARG